MANTNKPLPTRPAKAFSQVVTVPALEAEYATMPKIKADEVFLGLKGKADKGENFLRFAYIAWKGSINADQVNKAFTGALRVAMVAAFHAAIQGRDQNAPLPGEVVGRAWAAANEAWTACPEKAANAPKVEASDKDSTQANDEGADHVSIGDKAPAPAPADAAIAALTSERDALAALVDSISRAASIKEVRALLAAHGSPLALAA